MPNGFAGVMSGVSAVFFAYIGFDAISTTAEECKNPQRDLTKRHDSIHSSFVLFFILCLALVLTGMVNYTKLECMADPLAFVFESQDSKFIGLPGLFPSVLFLQSLRVLLVFQFGQPRIWMSMSRDGLLPKVFAKIHPKYKTPSFSTLLTGHLLCYTCIVSQILMW